jgi:transposase
MESTNKQSKSPSTRRYSPAEREQAVRLVRQLRKELGTDQGTVGRVARQLGYGVESVRSWVKQADIDQGVTPGTTTAEAERIKALEQENRELKRSNGDPAPGLGVFRPGGARPPVEVIVGFIDENREELGVEPICRDLQVAPSTYYAANRPTSNWLESNIPGNADGLATCVSDDAETKGQVGRQKVFERLLSRLEEEAS